MRVALTLAALVVAAGPAVATGPAATDKPSHDEQEAINTYVQASTADALCSAYRINPYQLSSFLEKQGFNTLTIRSTYPFYFDEFQKETKRLFDTDASKRRQCLDYFDKMGDFGIYPHILVRRYL